MESFPKHIKDFKTELKGKTVLVTGASRGIGKAIAIAFARESCNLVIVGRNKDRLEKAAEDIRSLSVNVYLQLIDVSDEKSVLSGLGEISKNAAPIDILVNNAGIYKTSSVLGHTSELWNQIISTNLNSAFIFSRELIHLQLYSHSKVFPILILNWIFNYKFPKLLFSKYNKEQKL